MANLDTRNKRGSAIGVDAPWMRIYPNPDGALTQPDRQHVAYKYSAIAASGAATFRAAWARGCNILIRGGGSTNA